MKHRILHWAVLAAAMLFIGSCQQPEEYTPLIERNGINSLTASFVGDETEENRFTSEIDYTNHVITVVFPYNYPRMSDNVLESSRLTKMKVVADLDNNVKITPSLMFMDMTKENRITVTTHNLGSVEYKVVAEIRKSNECSINSFSLPSKNITGIVQDGSISLISIEDIGSALAEATISHGATMKPDPRVEELDYTKETTIVVTAQNGVDKKEYIIRKDVPKKIDAGIRPGSAELIWVKRLTEIGLTQMHMTTGIAATHKYLVLNERGQDAVYLDPKTGEKLGTIDLSAIYGTKGKSLKNFYMTADDNDNILINNLAEIDDHLPLTIWRLRDVNSAPEVYYTTSLTGYQMGRKISVAGDIDKDAIITIPFCGFNGQFDRWQVKNGVMQPRILIAAQGIGSWGNNADVIYTDPSDVTSDYFAAFYADPRCQVWIDGKTNAIKAKGQEISSNWIQNSVDYIKFNNVGYLLSQSTNPWTWGTDDCLYMYDLSGGNLSKQAIDFNALGINGNYGAKAIGESNGNGTGDIAFVASEDGYYLYVYFMFTNGYVGCIRCDCIDM